MRKVIWSAAQYQTQKNCYFQEMLIIITIIIGINVRGSQIFINKYLLSTLHCTQSSARHH